MFKGDVKADAVIVNGATKRFCEDCYNKYKPKKLDDIPIIG